MSRALAFYFDYASPYAYLGAERVEALARRHRAELHWRPFLLGALFEAIGSPLVPIEAMAEPKRAHQRLDLFRWAEHLGVPLVWNRHFPLDTRTALRITLLVDEAHRGPLVRAFFRAAWAEDADLEDPVVIRRCLERSALPPELLDRARGPEARGVLRAATAEAIERGVPGAPAFVVAERFLFWGQDRMDFVGRALDGWEPAVG